MMRNPRHLWWIPIATYALSYIYLAFYHGTWWLWDTIIHEGGTLTLTETSLYASHFLGHIPSLVIIAILFAAWFRLFSQRPGAYDYRWLLAAAAFVALCVLGSLWHFGTSETLDYLLWRKQSITRNEPGGSFLLHLPSTLSLVVLIPLYIAALLRLFDKPILWQPRSLRIVAAAAATALLFSVLVSGSWQSVIIALTDPRYLAHSVRELATFPLTFFPLPLAYWLAAQPSGQHMTRSALVALAVCTVLAFTLLMYQTWIPLSVGISDLAQQPDFTRNPLPISYLLASHYFEHFLDTAFFAMLCLGLQNPRGMKR